MKNLIVFITSRYWIVTMSSDSSTIFETTIKSCFNHVFFEYQLWFYLVDSIIDRHFWNSTLHEIYSIVNLKKSINVFFVVFALMKSMRKRIIFFASKRFIFIFFFCFEHELRIVITHVDVNNRFNLSMNCLFIILDTKKKRDR
jgi:hypothetical protein